jgi:monoamine oxidase
MARTPLFNTLRRTLRFANWADAAGLTTSEAYAALERRDVLKGLGALATVGALGSAVRSAEAIAAPASPTTRVGIVGAGLAGLACAYELKKAGILATIHEASTREGGRCFSMGGTFSGPVNFPGQVVERGGEFIDTPHKSMLGYASEFKLPLEDVKKLGAGEVFYRFGNTSYPESVVVNEYRAFVAAMHNDLQATSGAPTADLHNAADVALDQTDLLTYLTTRSCGPVAKAAIVAAYECEYGLVASQQSCLNFLLFIHADRRSKFTPFGIFSDERFHLVGGNQQIPRAISQKLSGQIRYGEQLTGVKKLASGEYELSLKKGAQSLVARYDAIVLAIPFTVLRTVALDSSVQIPAWKSKAINELGYGTNAKQMVGFNGPYWLSQGCNGSSYSDLPNHQCTWETNTANATTTHAVLTDYSSGPRGARLDPTKVQTEAAAFVGDLNKVIVGALSHASRDAKGNLIAHLEAWPKNPLTRGSYTCYLKGQFTGIAGNEGKPVANCYFAGEHTNSFYEWQGYMEGAALAGKDACGQILQAIKVGTLKS